MKTTQDFARQWFEGCLKDKTKGTYLSFTRFSSQHCELDFSYARSEHMDQIGRYKGGLGNLLMRFMARSGIIDFVS